VPPIPLKSQVHQRTANGRIDAVGGFWPALVAILPDLYSTAHVIRRSTSAGLSRTDTGEQLPGSNGQHGFVAVQDGIDIERFLKTLHARCWLAGFGWMMVGVAGHLLERSIIDRSVGGPERLVFEGAPILDPPLAQDAESRRPAATDGDALDTIAACPPLSVVEKQAFAKLRAEASQQLQTESNTVREAFIARQTQRLMARHTYLSQDAAKRVIERQCRGVLLPDVELPFSDPELAGVIVADVLADPARFDGCVLADPIEGVEYGRTTAMVMRRRDGTPWIYSFAHGRTTYELKFDARAVRSAINQASNPLDVFIKHALAGDLNKVEEKQLLDDAALRAGVGVRIVTAELKSARWQREQELNQERRSRRLAERTDPRPQILNPAIDPSGGAHDSFTMAIAHREKDSSVVLDLLFERKAPFNPTQVTSEIAAMIKSYRCSIVTGDRYAAQWVVEAFAKTGIKYVQSERDRSEIYLDCLPLFTAGRARLIENARMVAQFAALERRTFSTGKDRVDHGRAGHDDVCNSAAGALVLAASRKAPMTISQGLLARARMPTSYANKYPDSARRTRPMKVFF
jgi:hypothetical protein